MKRTVEKTAICQENFILDLGWGFSCCYLANAIKLQALKTEEFGIPISQTKKGESRVQKGCTLRIVDPSIEDLVFLGFQFRKQMKKKCKVLDSCPSRRIWNVINKKETFTNFLPKGIIVN